MNRRGIPARTATGRFLVMGVLLVAVVGAVTSGRTTAFPVRGVGAGLGALAVIEALRWWSSGAGVDDRRVRPLTDPEVPPPTALRPAATLAEWEAIVEAATTNGRAALTRLAPRYRDLARQRLLLDHGVDLDTDPEGAARLLGADGWAFARPTVGPIPGPTVPGVAVARIERAAAALER